MILFYNTAISRRLSLCPVVPHRIHSPRVLNDEERYPLPLADLGEIDGAEDERQGVDDEKADIKGLFVPGHVLVVGDV